MTQDIDEQVWIDSPEPPNLYPFYELLFNLNQDKGANAEYGNKNN